MQRRGILFALLLFYITHGYIISTVGYFSRRTECGINAYSTQTLHQQERQRALEERLAPPTPDVRLSAPSASSDRLIFPVEKPCFVIDRVTLSGTEPLPRWLPLQRIANQALGQCLGGQGINQLMSQLQNRLVGHGYVTTRVLAPQQDLNSGTLALQVVPGKIHRVALTPESDRHVTLFSAFPARPGHLLDLRDI
ncbi:POTRA domain, ShlB-type family protein [Yersinia pestis Angola]|nr:POTRA domain, ShlB-type family protein [Yersinia pestis Angola]